MNNCKNDNRGIWTINGWFNQSLNVNLKQKKEDLKKAIFTNIWQIETYEYRLQREPLNDEIKEHLELLKKRDKKLNWLYQELIKR